MDISSIAVIINAVMMICIIVGGYIAIRSGKHQQVGTIQAQAIDALKAELDAVQRRVEILERENTRLTHQMNLIKTALKKRGLDVTIDGDLITIDDGRGNSSQYSHIQEGNH